VRACPASCRAPAVEPDTSAVSGVPRWQNSLPLRARSRDKPRSHALRAESKAVAALILFLRPAGGIKSISLTPFCFCPEGVGAWLAGDLPGTGSRTRHLCHIRHPALAEFPAAARQIAGQATLPRPAGRIKSRRRAPSASGRRPWERACPASCREPAVESAGSVGQVHSVRRACWQGVAKVRLFAIGVWPETRCSSTACRWWHI
jgi:hypothetical protein